VHLKDVREEAAGWSLADVWRRGGFCELGAGVVDLDAFLHELESSDYLGWVVVEQDALPGDLARARDSQAPESQLARRARDLAASPAGGTATEVAPASFTSL